MHVFIIIELCGPKCTLEAKINYEHNLLNIPYYLFLVAAQSSRSLYPLYLCAILMVSVTPYIYFNSYCVNLTCVNLTCAMFVSYCIKRGGGGGGSCAYYKRLGQKHYIFPCAMHESHHALSRPLLLNCMGYGYFPPCSQ